MNIKIRVPNLHQIADIVELGKEMHEESQFNVVPYNAAKTEKFLLGVRYNPDWIFLAAVDEANEVIGMFLGYVTDYFMADGLVAEDKFLYIKKDRRGVLGAKMLLDTYIAWAKTKGCDQVYMNHTTGVDTTRGARFFERVGLGQIGTIHVSNLRGH